MTDPSPIEIFDLEDFSPLIIGKVIVGHVIQINSDFIPNDDVGQKGDWIYIKQNGEKFIIPRNMFGI